LHDESKFHRRIEAERKEVRKGIERREVRERGNE
jgi:hypothetical protein